jgi:acylphosphatase
MTGSSVRKRVLVSGRVQGVWYRGAMQSEARSLGLVGWVKNLPDGRVEAVVQGTTESVSEILRWCETGPPAASVSSVDSRDEPVSELTDFDVRY